MSAVIPPNGTSKIRQLDATKQPDEQVTTDQVKDPTILARLAMRILRDVADLNRRFSPPYLDFEDVVVDATGSKVFRFTHSFNARVRWWVVDWKSTIGGAPVLDKASSSDLNTLALVSSVAGTVTVRVMASG